MHWSLYLWRDLAGSSCCSPAPGYWWWYCIKHLLGSQQASIASVSISGKQSCLFCSCAMEARGYISCLLHLLCHKRGLGHQQNMLPQVQFKPVAFTSWMQQSPPVEPPWKVFCQPTRSRALAGLAHTGKLGNFVGNWSPGCSDIELWRSLVSSYGILELCCWLRHGNLGSCSLKSGISAVF